ncbi:MAG: ABC transporter ATP-binding protein [Clostridia bacterium]|nr:ABC transporter ATP-binding protein [Clostridia bacterium]
MPKQKKVIYDFDYRTPAKLRARFLSLMPQLKAEDIIVVIAYNIDDARPGTRVDGFAALTEEKLYRFLDGACVDEHPAAGIKEFTCRAGIGCTSIEYKDDEGDHFLCRADMSFQREYAAVAKRLNIKLQQGSFYRDYEKEINRICPKCGRPLQQGSDICYHCVDKKGYVMRLLKIAAPYKLPVIASIFLFFLLSGINLISPQINRIMVDDYIRTQDVTLLGQFFLIIACLLGLNLLTQGLSILRTVLLVHAGNGLIVRLREMVFEKIQQLSIAKISKRTAGELMHRVNHDTNMIRQFLTNDIGNLIQQTVVFIAVGIMIFAYDWRLAVLILAPVPLMIFTNKLLWGRLRRMYHRQWMLESKADTVLHDIFSGIRVVKSFGMEKRENERYDEVISDLKTISMRNERYYSVLSPIVNFVMGLGEFFMLFYFGNMVLGMQMSLGEMLQFTAYANLIYGPLGWMANLPRRLMHLLTAIVKVFDVVDEKIDVADKEAALEMDIKGDIVIDDISFGYDDTADVLKHVSAHIKPGEMVGIVGKSGVGKSTLINLVMRLYDVNAGSIRIDGVDVRDISQNSLRSQIGVVLQETFLFAGSIYDNIAYAKPGATRDEVITAAKAAGAHSFIMKLPDAYNTKVGERGHTLSGGERQRVSIARALLHNPRILILDEATASLDTETEKQIQESLQKLTRDRTTLAIAHRLSTLRNADKLIVLDKGTVAEFGTHDELIRKKGIYYGLVMAQRQMSKMAVK